MNVDIYLPMKISMERVISLSQYFGEVEMGGHRLYYILRYHQTNEPKKSEMTLQLANPDGKFTELYEKIKPQLYEILHEHMIQYEKTVKIAEKGLLGNIAGDHSSRFTIDENPKNPQMKFDYQIKSSEELKSILKKISR